MQKSWILPELERKSYKKYQREAGTIIIEKAGF